MLTLGTSLSCNLQLINLRRGARMRASDWTTTWTHYHTAALNTHTHKIKLGLCLLNLSLSPTSFWVFSPLIVILSTVSSDTPALFHLILNYYRWIQRVWDYHRIIKNFYTHPCNEERTEIQKQKWHFSWNVVHRIHQSNEICVKSKYEFVLPEGKCYRLVLPLQLLLPPHYSSVGNLDKTPQEHCVSLPSYSTRVQGSVLTSGYDLCRQSFPVFSQFPPTSLSKLVTLKLCICGAYSILWWTSSVFFRIAPYSRDRLRIHSDLNQE